MAWLPLAALLLAPVRLLGDRGPHLSNSNPDPPPIANLRMEPGTRRLTWDLLANVSAIRCFENDGYSTGARKNLFCKFPVLPRCTPFTYTVAVTLADGGTYSAGIRYPEPEGDPLAAAQNLSCRIHDKDFLTCSWAVGRAAPSDVQYEFSLEDTTTSQRWACPRYTATAQGTRVQCRFDTVSAFSGRQHRLLVTGSGPRGPVPCTEAIEFLPDIETLAAPALNATCNRSLALLEWDRPSHFHRWLDYDLEIQQAADTPFLQKVQKVRYFLLTNPRTFSVRIRARDSHRLLGPWSAPRRFVCDPEADPWGQVWLSSCLIALGTLGTVGVAVFLCRRYSVLKTVFPPIPRLKDPMGGVQEQKMFPWETGRPPQEECPVAEVQILREP